MPEKIIVELIVAQPGRREGEGRMDASAPSLSNEVEGHYPITTWLICPHCGSHRVIDIDTDSTQEYWYTCSNCGYSYYLDR